MTSENDICLFTKAQEKQNFVHGCQITLWRLLCHPLDGQMRFANNQTTHLIPFRPPSPPSLKEVFFFAREHRSCGMKINCKRLFYGKDENQQYQGQKHQRDFCAGGVECLR